MHRAVSARELLPHMGHWRQRSLLGASGWGTGELMAGLGMGRGHTLSLWVCHRCSSLLYLFPRSGRARAPLPHPQRGGWGGLCTPTPRACTHSCPRTGDALVLLPKPFCSTVTAHSLPLPLPDRGVPTLSGPSSCQAQESRAEALQLVSLVSPEAALHRPCNSDARALSCFPACCQAAMLQQPQLARGEPGPPASLSTSLHLQLTLAHLVHPADPPSLPQLCTVCLCPPLLPLCHLPHPRALDPCLATRPCCLYPRGPSPSAPASSPAFSWNSLGLHLSHQRS